MMRPIIQIRYVQYRYTSHTLCQWIQVSTIVSFTSCYLNVNPWPTQPLAFSLAQTSLQDLLVLGFLLRFRQ